MLTLSNQANTVTASILPEALAKHGRALHARKKIVVVFGTRPEAIKMAPLVHALKESQYLEPVVIATAQHREMLDQVLHIFDIKPDYDLNVMRPNQTLPDLTSRLIASLDEIVKKVGPSAMLVQGDTTTVLAASLVSFYNTIPIGHVEAGLRTNDLRSPFPEEMNRVITGRLADWHFAPTQRSAQNLLNEGVPAGAVFMTGNTVIDALFNASRHPDKVPRQVIEGRRMLLVTTHRRENFGEPLKRICAAILELLERNPELDVLFPVHPNPNVSSVVREWLGEHPRVGLCPPLDYLSFIAAMEAAHIILSDSGGVQEEAPALGKPVLVLREETERPEAVTFGVAALVGTDTARIVAKAQLLLTDPLAYREMARGASPYGDGQAAARIVAILEDAMIGSRSITAGTSYPYWGPNSMKPLADINRGREVEPHDRRLIYFSSVPYASYAQRPHFMVRAFLDGGFCSVLWIDPYPTRLPSFADLRRIRQKLMPGMHADEERITVLRPSALPIEPLPMSGWLNRIFAWRHLIAQLREFAWGTHHCVLAIGRPSKLSEWALEHIRHERSFLDILDNFPAFYRGLSRISMKARLHAICQKVTDVYCSSSNLAAEVRTVRPDAVTVFNGYPTNHLPNPSTTYSRQYIGYVGTIGEWFDWPLVRALALALPNVPIRLIGPEFVARPANLPANIEFLGEQPQTAVAELILTFTVGLIPFRINDLTSGVDPIKFYEYRCMGLPIWSTAFGEMCSRGNSEGVLHISPETNWQLLWERAQATVFSPKDIALFRTDVSWNKRFEPILQRSQSIAANTHGITTSWDL